MTHRSKKGVKRRKYEVNVGDCRKVSAEKSSKRKTESEKSEVSDATAD